VKFHRNLPENKMIKAVLLFAALFALEVVLAKRVLYNTHYISSPVLPPRPRLRADDDFYGSLVPLTPAKVKAAYGFSDSPTAGAGQTVAIIDAFDHPNIEEDLAYFNSIWGLPSCTTANGCFKKVNQTGGSTLPVANFGWSIEIALDVQWVHSIAPGAKILLVLGNTNNNDDLNTAVAYASQHAQYVTMSYGSDEYPEQVQEESFYTTPGVSYFASTGDIGITALYPATSPHVIGVGGTTLNYNVTQLVSETGWSGSGGGCSVYFNKPAAQKTGDINCHGKRSSPDVAMLADPESGVYVYTSYNCPKADRHECWYRVGGTSLASPLFAARAAISGKIFKLASVYGGTAGPTKFKDIVGGSSYDGISHLEFCIPGYDLVTGLGTWAESHAPTQPATTLAPTPAPPAHTSSFIYGNYRYRLYRSPVATAAEAEQQCQSLLGHLASISGQTLNDLILQNYPGVAPYFWIGLHKNSNGQYTWLDGQPATYTNFEAGQPNASFDSVIFSTQGKWKTTPGTEARPYLCKIAKDL
jgi:subtilase family serine protease